MANGALKEAEPYTLGRLVRRFGSIAFDRIRPDPAPGTATEADVIAIERSEGLLYELVDGALVGKVLGAQESFLAIEIATSLQNFVRPRQLGAVLGADGMYRLNPELVRIPDVSFIALDRLPNGKLPRDAIRPIVPDLAIEVLSKGNSRKEMDDKVIEYFAAGVKLLWYVGPSSRSVRVYSSARRSRVYREGEALEGGAVLPGFRLPVADVFAGLDALFE